MKTSTVGLLLVQLLNILNTFQYFLRQNAEVESLMTSVERIIEYADLEKEPLEKGKIKPAEDWPQNGDISFDNVSYAYDEGLANVLKNVSFEIASNEKVGIIGRTGAGKSTIFQTLFRMSEPSGSILIDGVDTKDVSLHDLRSRISIIPVRLQSQIKVYFEIICFK